MATAGGKPRILILGGVGMIGRNFVQYLVDNKLCSSIRVADKSMPEMAYLNPFHEKAFASPLVEYVQADLSRPDHVVRAFTDEKGEFDFVFNLAAETRFGLSEAVYKDKILDVAEKVAAEAAKHPMKKFIEVSTAQVYKPVKKGAKETSPLAPWTLQSQFKLQAEEVFQKSGVPLVILRPSIVYGPADVAGLMPRIVCASTYKHTGAKMEFLWGKDLRINTVHVIDMCQAMWHAATTLPAGSVFNVSDKGDTRQGTLNPMLQSLFDIKIGFVNAAISKLAKLKLQSLVDQANEDHILPWAELLKIHGIKNTPLSPEIDIELLKDNHLGVDGSAIEKTGFKYCIPALTEATIRQIVMMAIAQKHFPSVF